MTKFEIRCVWEVCGTLTVDANNLEEAIKLAEDTEKYGLPDESDYVDGSFQVDRNAQTIWDYGDAVSLEVMANDEWIRVFSSVDFEYVDEMDFEDAASTFASALVDALEDSGFDVAYAKGQRSTCDGWQGFNLFRHKVGPVGTFSELSDSETGKIHAALDHAADVMHSKWTATP